MAKGVNKKLKGLFIGMLLLLLASAIPNPAWAPWVTLEDYRGYRLKPIKNTEGASELVLRLDSDDFPHIAWSGSSGIHYLKWDGAQWVNAGGSGQESRKIAGTGRFDSLINMCLDSAGHPQIAWDKNRSIHGEEEDDVIIFVSEVCYLRWNGSEWVDADGVGRETTKVGTGYEYDFPSLCLDSNNHPHLLVKKEYASLLCKPHVYYLRWNGSQWVEIHNPGQREGDVCDITRGPGTLLLRLDSNDKPHIVLTSGEKHGIEISYLSWHERSKLWGREFIKCEESESYRTPSLCLDSKDRPHIAFCCETKSSGFSPHRDIYYLWRNDSSWVDADGVGRESENISKEEYDSITPSLCLDSKGHPHIAWGGEGAIRYVHWDGNKWVDPDVSAWPELVRLLKDKWKENQWWTPEALTGIQEAIEAGDYRTIIGESAESPFLCLDSKGRPCIAWIDGIYGGGICYAKWVSAEEYCDKYTYYIKGYVRDENGNPVSGVKVTLSSYLCDGAYITSNNGYYEFICLLKDSYTVTPHKSGYSFSPEQYEYSAFHISSKDNQNFEMRSLQE